MKKRISAVVATAIALVVVTATAAFAHAEYWTNGGDEGVVWSDHHSGQLRDNECDGKDVYFDILFTDLTTRRIYGLGCDGGWRRFTTSRQIWKVWFCEPRPGGDYCTTSYHYE